MTILETKLFDWTKFKLPPENAQQIFGGWRRVRAHHIAQAVARRRSYPLQSTLDWGRHYLPHHFVKPASAMHLWLGDQLDRFQRVRGLKVNLIGPRGSAKSTIATLCYVLRAALEGWEPYIWIVSDTKEQAHTHLENVKWELTDNELLAGAYPDAVGEGRHWRARSIELANGMMIESYGTLQRIRGRRRRSERPTLIVCDDLQNDGHMDSADLRDTSRQWFHGTLLNAGTSQTNIINLATALHREALALELHESAGWTSTLFPAIQSWPTNTSLWDQWEAIYCGADKAVAAQAARKFYEQNLAAMKAGAVVLWPEVENLYTLMQMRVESGRTAFEREKQGSPADPERCEWPDMYFAEHVWFDHWPSELVVRVIALDPSKGRDARRSDYSAYVLVGIDRNGVIYVEADMARRPTPQMVADGAELCRRFRPDAFGVEANQFQELLCNELASEFARQDVTYITPAAIHNHIGKLVRIRRIGPYLSQRRLRFLSNSPSTRQLVNQLRDFPSGAHDDGPDALEMALRLAEDVVHGLTTSDGLGDRLPVG
jgi:predicted phage terminase large subunit-like protein